MKMKLEKISVMKYIGIFLKEFGPEIIEYLQDNSLNGKNLLRN